MEQILAIFESPQDSPKIIVSSQSSKRIEVKGAKPGPRPDIDEKSKQLNQSQPEYDMFITNSRFICAVVWDEETDAPQGTSLPYDVAVHQSYAPTKNARRESYRGRSADEIAEMHPKSLSIPFDEVDWVRVKKGLFGAHVEISAPTKEKKPFKIPIDKRRYNDAKSILSSHLGFKMR